MTIAAALARISERLATAGCESPRVDAEFLLAHVLGTTRSALRAEPERGLSAETLGELEALVARRERREPLPYVLGEWGFRRLTLGVDQRVLVPRPETEMVVERCLALICDLEEPRVLDIGTGSGAIALAIADEHPGARVIGIDVSADALEVARANAVRTNLAAEFVRWDFFDGLPEGPWDLVVSNPPYVRPEEIENLEPEVRDWEPRLALVGDGATEAVAHGALVCLRAGGAIVLEVADGDSSRIVALLGELGYVDVLVTKDLAQRSRVVEGVSDVSTVGDVVAAIRAGELVVIPTDTVYGLACDAYREESARALSELKRRELGQPIALVIASVDSLLDCIPELGEASALLLALLPGPFTLVLPNPARRYPWLTGDRPDTIGVRVPDVEGRAAEILSAVGPIAATSANRHGEKDPRRLEDVPQEILTSVAAALDGGELPGTPSTVLDLTGTEPVVLREGAVPAHEALARVAAAAQ